MISRGRGRFRMFSLSSKHQHGVMNNHFIEILDVDGVYRKIRYLDEGSSHIAPPLVLLCGSAQTIDTWSLHIHHLALNRRVIVPEMRCQGKTELLSKYGSIEQQIVDLAKFLDHLNLAQVDIAGFSLGGRIGLGFASENSDRVRKLSITAVPYSRPKLGQLIIQSWKESLDSNNLTGTAWSCVLNSFSDEFMIKNSRSIPLLVQRVIANNDIDKLRDLFQHTLSPHQPTNEYYAYRISSPTQVICGSHDRIAGQGSEKALAEVLPGCRYDEVPNVGHSVPFERPAKWRSLLSDFLDE